MVVFWVVVEEEIMQVEVVMLEVHHLILSVGEQVVVDPVEIILVMVQMELLALSM